MINRGIYRPKLSSSPIPPPLLRRSPSHLVSPPHASSLKSETSVISEPFHGPSTQPSAVLMRLHVLPGSLSPCYSPLSLPSADLRLEPFVSLPFISDRLLIHLPHSSVISFRSGAFVCFIFEFSGPSWELVPLAGMNEIFRDTVFLCLH